MPSLNLRQRLGLLRTLAPIGMAALAVAYELGLAQWIDTRWGPTYRIATDLLLFATVGPLLAFLWLNVLVRWLEERETSDLQAQVLAQARRHVQTSRELNDQALQNLFAASALITSLKETTPGLDPAVLARLEELQQALDAAIRRIRLHLSS